jgi:hypothetical protein
VSSSLRLIACEGQREYSRYTLKVTFVTCLLAAVVVGAPACGGSTEGNGREAASEFDPEPRRDIQPEAQKRAESIVLELSDFPEGWRASPSGDDRLVGAEVERCIGVDFSSLTLIGFAESKEFRKGDWNGDLEGDLYAASTSYAAASEGWVFGSEEQAAGAIREYSEGIESDAVDRCAHKRFESPTANDQGEWRTELGRIAAGELSVTAPEVDETRAWQIAVPFKRTDREGVELSSRFQLDAVFLREGDMVALVRTQDNPVNAFDRVLRDKLLHEVADRMRQATSRR